MKGDLIMNESRAISNIITITVFVIATVVTSLASAPEWAEKSSSNTTALSEVEIEMLSYMREEEKLARDVYLLMYETWETEIFSTIAESEQTHMDSMKKKLDKYNLEDSADPAPGVFNNEFLQEKYDELIVSGSSSLIDGLYAGATIEEIDMIDIMHAIDVTTHLDIVTAYQNLLEGSKNHLRAYVRGLSAQGFDYSPQFISQELFDAVIGL